jgi:glycosyltransferase involved in cell wall biosynthesis
MVRGAAGRVEGDPAVGGRGRAHICIVTETYPPEINGVALTLSRLVSGLRARGHLVSLVRPRQDTDALRHGGSDEMLVPGLAVPGLTGVRVGLPAGRALRRRWEADRPCVVYVATEGPLGWSALRAGERLGLALWSGFHTNFHRYARHYGAGWLSPATLRYLRRFHNRTRSTLVATEELRVSLRVAGFANIAVLGRGVDGGLFTPARRSPMLRASWGASDGHLVALHVGRVAPEKNIPLAVQAYQAMQRAWARTRFVAVGDGPLRAALQAACPDLLFCGARTGEALAAHYASADVLLLPSETETFGNVTLEAMASGLAVVAYDYAAARVHIRSGESGVLVPCGQPDDSPWCGS